MEDEAAKFRRELEEKTGEKVSHIAMASLVEGAQTTAQGKAPSRSGNMESGLLILTDRSLRFTQPANTHWLSSLFLSHDRNSPPQTLPDIVIPLGDGLSISMPKRPLLARLLGPSETRVIVSWMDGEAERSTLFSVDPRDAIASALASLAEGTTLS